jgi:UDP-glucose 4-epimerase
MKKIMITGGAGYIGSHCFLSLVKSGFKPIIVDNFSNSNLNRIKELKTITKNKIVFYNVDIRDRVHLKSIFRQHNFYAVIHCAAFKSVQESSEIPISYFDNNIISTLSLLQCMQEKKIFKLIFSSSALVYNQDEDLVLKETSNTGKTSSSYGTSKYIIERMLMDVVQSDPRWSIYIARYFNPVGNHSSGLIADEPKSIINNLLPNIIKVAQKKLPYLKVFGKNYPTRDGTCIRDYIHVTDLAEGHVAMLKDKKLKKGLEIYNFGSGKGFTVLEVIQAFQNQTGISIPIKFVERRKGDQPILICCTKNTLKKLSWKVDRDLRQAMIDISLNIKLQS